jgi:DNA-binding CsgD family transcriptional regulator
MSSGRWQSESKITDEQVRAIMLAPEAESQKNIGARLGIHPRTVHEYRRRKNRRAVRIAKEMGLLGRAEPAPVEFTDAERRLIRDMLEP